MTRKAPIIRALIIGLSALLLGATLGTPAARAAPLTTQSLGGGLTAQNLASSLAGAGVTISNVVYSGAPEAAGTFAGGSDVVGFDGGVILSTGRIADVAGPNDFDDSGVANSMPGDSDLNVLAGSGYPTFDAALLEFDFVPTSGQVTFQYVFASEEYNEFVDSAYNDVFAFYVNGTNCARVNNLPVSVNTINKGKSGTAAGTNGDFYINNPSDGLSAPRDTQMDGLTTILTCQAGVNQGATNHLKLAIADTSDRWYDSVVFIKAGSFTAQPTGCINPNPLNFGSQIIGSPSPSQLSVFTNCGTAPLTLNTVALGGANSGDFTFTSSCAGMTLAPGASCGVRVTFKPTASGARAATTSFTFTGGSATLQLNGTGEEPHPPFVLTVQTVGSCTVSVAPNPGPYPVATDVTLTPVPAAGWTFVYWKSERGFAGWADPWSFTMNANHTVTAYCVPAPSFPDYTPGSSTKTDPVIRMAALTIIRGYQDGRFGPNDTTLRAQMAALIARGMGLDRSQTWDQEDHGNSFPDQGVVDADLWRNIGTLYYYNVARGYQDGTYNPTGDVLYAQTISFITRAMVTNGYWVQHGDDPGLYPNVPADSGHRSDIATYVYYSGALPGTASTGQDWTTWNQSATRLWFSQAEWQALNSYFNHGFVP